MARRKRVEGIPWLARVARRRFRRPAGSSGESPMKMPTLIDPGQTLRNLFLVRNQGLSPIQSGESGPSDWLRRACPGCGLEGSEGLKIQYQPDSGRGADRLSMELPQREGDGKQALVTSPLLPNACRLPDSSPAVFVRPSASTWFRLERQHNRQVPKQFTEAVCGRGSLWLCRELFCGSFGYGKGNKGDQLYSFPQIEGQREGGGALPA